MEQDLDRELRYHLDRRAEDLMKSGLSETEARRQAAVEFGGVAQVQEEVRDTWIWRWLDDRSRDIRYAFRTLLRSPGFTATAVLSLALGIGANAAIFSLLDQVLLRVLPVKEPERLVLLDWKGNPVSVNWGSGNLLSYPLCRDLQELDQFFDGVFCRHPTSAYLLTGQQPEPVSIEIVSGSYFRVLGVRPELGRLIDDSDDLRPEAHPVVVLSYNYWKNRLGGAPDVVGRKVLVNNRPMTVIGIAPAIFRGVDLGQGPALWIPAMMKRQATPEFNELFNRRAFWMHVFGRLKPGISAERVKAGLQPWFKSMLEADAQREGFPRVSEEQRRRYLASTIDVIPAARGRSDLRSRLEEPLFVLMTGTVLLLLLACVNVASLFLARAAARNLELTTRLALGASRGRITWQLLADSMLIALGGGLLGFLAAPAVSQVLLSFLSDDLSARIDQRVFVFTFLVTVAVGALCGLVPAFQVSRIALISSLKERARIAASGGVRLRKALVVGQVAFTLILLIGAGLFVRTLERLQTKGPGFASGSLLMFRADPVSNGYSDSNATQVMRELLAKLKDVPGVERVAVANSHLLTGGTSSSSMTIQSDKRIVTDRAVHYMRVSPGFFSTLGAQLVAGRDFEERDLRDRNSKETGSRSIIVSESFARRYFGGSSPIGHRLGFGNRPGTAANIEIVGVVRGFSRRNLRDEIEQAFVPFWDRDSGDGTFYVKVLGKPEAAFASIRAAVAQVDPVLPIVNMVTLDDQIDQSLTTERMLATLSSGFGAIALLLSVVGLYGVMSFVVTRRTQEIGIRMALGATRSTAMWLVVRDAVVMIGAGTATALPCVWALGRLVEAQLFGVRAVDGLTIAAASSLLALVALGAAMLPAWRAASVSPTEALRFE
ncbi:MAG TPA: ABC transporter permease [Anaerolineales bacterium]